MKPYTEKIPILPMDSITLFYYERFEAFRINHSDAMAITLCPKGTDILIPWKQHFKFGYTYHKILQKACHFMFIPEFRETDNSIHYHGMIQPFNKMAFKSRTFSSLKRIGFFKFKKNLDSNWSKYCVKETKDTQPLINKFFLNCGPYMYYNCCKELWPIGQLQYYKLADATRKEIRAEAKAIKSESDNIKLWINFPELFRK